MKNFSRVLLLIVWCLTLADASLAKSPDRSTVGLVLSGGGARGMAHVGVIKVLEEMRIPVDYVAGTSMGAIVGGLYASGMTAAELEAIVAASDWSALFQDRPPRRDRSFRRKSDDVGFLVDFDVGLKPDGLVVPPGLIQGQNLTLALRRLTLPVATVRDFDRLPVPFRALATDIESGEGIVLGFGDLALAMRASMSAPGVFNPVQLDGRSLVDGGVANNLPIDVAKDMGADVLIVADVGFPLLKEEELKTAFQITTQMLTILINARAREQIETLGEHDILITPDLGRFGSQDFDRSVEAVGIGESAARRQAQALRNLSVSVDEYRAYQERLQRLRRPAPVIHQVSFENESRLSTKVIETRLNDQRGGPIDLALLEADLADVYGLDTFETVDYSVFETVDGAELLIRSREKSWGPTYVRFGVNLEDDFDGSSNYNIGARMTVTELNQLGAELRLDSQIGENPRLFAEFYQPLDYASRWFINPSIELQRSKPSLYQAGDRIAELLVDDVVLSLAAGRQFGNWGELRLTLSRGYGDTDVSVGDPALGGGSADAGVVSVDLGYDTIDRLAIPRSGAAFTASWLGSRESLGAEQEFDLAAAFFLKPQTWGRNTLLHWWNGATAYDVTTSATAPFSLGGLFSLSGYAPQELLGRHTAIGRLIYYRRLGGSTMGPFNTTVYAGASLEHGNVWLDSDDIGFDSALTAGSVFVVLDTLVGPLYLAYGSAEGDRQSFYLFLGQTF